MSQHELRRCYIAMPTYERHENETLAAAYRHAIPEGDENYLYVNAPSKGNSLLAMAFNNHWVQCLDHNLNKKEEGTTDWFMLLHGDVEPSDCFLHVMIEEALKHNLDVLHACVAIKDGRGATSTGLGSISMEWSATRKVMIPELDLLPETFMIEDCIGASAPEYPGLDWSRSDHIFTELMKRNPIDLCMLPNTGCMLVKIDDWCWGYPGFVIKDRLAAIKPDGEGVLPKKVDCHWPFHYRLPFDRDVLHQVHNIPEDWNFGRWCAREGLRVGATTKVTTNHWGNARFPCKRGEYWGNEKTDEWFWNCKERM